MVLAKLQSCNQRILPIHLFHLPKLASLQGTSQHFHFGLSCFASAIGGRQLATQRFHLVSRRDGHLGMRMPKNAENPIGIQTMCVPHIIKCKINGDVWIIYSIGQDLKQN